MQYDIGKIGLCFFLVFFYIFIHTHTNQSYFFFKNKAFVVLKMGEEE